MKRRCANPECRQTFTPSKYGRQDYCSRRCRWRVRYVTRRATYSPAILGQDARLALDISLDRHAHRSEACACGGTLRFIVGVGGMTLQACDRGHLAFMRPRLRSDARRRYGRRTWAAA